MGLEMRGVFYDFIQKWFKMVWRGPLWELHPRRTGGPVGCPILGTGQGLCTGGFPGSGSQKEEFEIHGKFIEGFQKLPETFWKLPESFWKRS